MARLQGGSFLGRKARFAWATGLGMTSSRLSQFVFGPCPRSGGGLSAGLLPGGRSAAEQHLEEPVVDLLDIMGPLENFYELLICIFVWLTDAIPCGIGMREAVSEWQQVLVVIVSTTVKMDEPEGGRGTNRRFTDVRNVADRRRGFRRFPTAPPAYNQSMTTFRTTPRAFLVLLMACAAHRSDAGEAGVQGQASATIRETQITLTTGRTRFQGTVIGKEGGTLTFLTSAHCLSPEDVGESIGVHQRGGSVRARLTAVARNPDFHPIRSRDRNDPSVRGVLGVDNAIAALVVGPSGGARERFLARVRPADMTARRQPGRPGAVVTIHVVDQTGEEHVVRAGNHLNPKCLAWGHTVYRVRPGDSGSGVFLVSESPREAPRRLLIGNVSLTDARGGLATLISRADRWVEHALSPRKASEAETGQPPP